MNYPKRPKLQDSVASHSRPNYLRLKVFTKNDRFFPGSVRPFYCGGARRGIVLPIVKARLMDRTDVTISICGELDKHTAAYVTRVAEYMIDHTDTRPSQVELDLTDVTRVDELGFGAVLRLAADASLAGAVVVVRCAAKRMVLKGRPSDRGVARDRIRRMLRRQFKTVIRRRRTRPAVMATCSAHWRPGPRVGRRGF